MPPSLLLQFLERAKAECEGCLTDVRINSFGYLGNGDVNYNLSPLVGHDGFTGFDRDFALDLGRLANAMGGSFAAKHGLDRAKITLADQLHDNVECQWMTRLKTTFDPPEHLNRGVVVAARI